MRDQVWFDDVPVIGELSSKEIAARLRLVGEDEVAEAFEAVRTTSSHTFGPDKLWWERPDKPWLHTAHAFGYLPPAQDGNTSLAIQSAEAIPAEPALKNARVKNDQDEALLSLLESDIFKNGLHLITTVQPALVPLSELAHGLTKMLLTRHENISVQDIDLGLDFSTLLMRPHLAQGSYLAVQVPESLAPVWDWGEWVYHPASGLVMKRDDHHQTIPYNYLVFSISRYEDA